MVRIKILLYAKSWKRCVQPPTQKTGLGGVHGRHKRVLWKESAHRFRRTFDFAESFDEPGGKGAFEMRHPVNSLFLFVGTHFRILFRTFIVHLRTVYASPKKLARPLGEDFPFVVLTCRSPFHGCPTIPVPGNVIELIQLPLRGDQSFRGGEDHGEQLLPWTKVHARK